MDLNIFGLKYPERNVAKDVENRGHRVAEISFVLDDSFEGVKQIWNETKIWVKISDKIDDFLKVHQP